MADTSERNFLRDLSEDQAERLRLVRAGLPVPDHLLAPKGSGGNPAYKKLAQPKPLRMTPRKNLEGTLKQDTRKVHRIDKETIESSSSMVECGLFWKNILGEEKLRVSADWKEVTCLRCLTYRGTRLDPEIR